MGSEGLSLDWIADPTTAILHLISFQKAFIAQKELFKRRDYQCPFKMGKPI